MKRKKKCDAHTWLCSGQVIRRYGVNGSEKKGKTFNICLACLVTLRRSGDKFKPV